jgi:phosphatidate cytidylyltransferase
MSAPSTTMPRRPGVRTAKPGRAPVPHAGAELAARLLVAAVGIPATIWLVHAGGWVLAAAAGALAAGGCLEICRLARRSGVRPFTAAAAAAAAAAFPLIAAARPAVEEAAPWMWGMTLLLTLVSAAAAAWRRQPGARPLEAVAVTVTAPLVTGGTLAFVVLLRHMPLYPNAYDGDAALALFPLVLAWSADTAAFGVGRAWGRRPLTRVSPGKTWEGSAAGAAACMAVGWLYATAVLPPGAGFAGWMGAAAGALVAVAGLAGDLAKSAWKRQAGVKDSGHVFPGHGGILDRMDSTFYALPVVYVLAALAAARMLPEILAE